MNSIESQFIHKNLSETPWHEVSNTKAPIVEVIKNEKKMSRALNQPFGEARELINNSKLCVPLIVAYRGRSAANEAIARFLCSPRVKANPNTNENGEISFITTLLE